MTNIEKYKNIFCEIFGVNESQLDTTFTFAEIEEWNSLTHLTLITELEDTFSIMLDTEDILHFGSFENGIKILSKYGIDFTL